MDAQFETFLNDLGSALGKFKTTVLAVTGSPITTEMESIFPSITGAIGKLVTTAGIAGAFGAAMPAIEGAIAAYEALGGKPLDFGDPNVPGYQDRQDREKITG